MMFVLQQLKINIVPVELQPPAVAVTVIERGGWLQHTVKVEAVFQFTVTLVPVAGAEMVPPLAVQLYVTPATTFETE